MPLLQAGSTPRSRPLPPRLPPGLFRLFVLAGVCTLPAGCTKEEERAVVAQPVRVFAVQASGERPFRRFPGEVVSPRTVRLSFEVSGRLLEFPIQVGQIVKEGDLIGQIDPSDFAASRDSAQARFDAAKINFDRSVALQARGALPALELDRARQEFEMSEAALRTAARALEETRLVSPFEGRIAERIARKMQNVRAQENVAVLEEISTLEIEINLPERDMISGNRGVTVADAREFLEAKVVFPSLPDQPVDLMLETMTSRADPVARTFLVSFSFDPPESQNILPGMTGTVLVRTRPEARPGGRAEDGAQDMRVVPIQAITTLSGQSTVWRLDPEKMTVSPVPVEVSSITEDQAIVRAGALALGEEIVASGARFLADGMSVRRMETRNSALPR